MVKEAVDAIARHMAAHDTLQKDFLEYARSIGCPITEHERMGVSTMSPGTEEQRRLLAAWWSERTGQPTVLRTNKGTPCE